MPEDKKASLDKKVRERPVATPKRRCRLVRHDGNPEAAGHIAILVHGTGARNAPWTREDSKLSGALRHNLGSVAIYKFLWSGGNSHGARSDAGLALKREVKELMPKDSRTAPKLHVITHSHGGNVLAYAMRNEPHGAEALKVDSAVCLATPFLHVRKKDLPTTLGLYLYSVLGLLLIWGGAIVAWRNALFVFSVELFVVTAMAAVALCSYGFARLSRRGRSVDDLQLPLVDKKKLLIFRPVGDEAAAALGTAHFASLVVGKAWTIVDFLSARFKEILAGFVGGLLIVGWLLNLSGAASNQWLGWLHTLAMGGQETLLGVFYIGIAVSGILVAVLLTLLIVFQLPFGWDSIHLSLSAQISAEDSPPGDYVVHQIDVRKNRDAQDEGLEHSWLYQDEKVIKDIVTFLERAEG